MFVGRSWHACKICVVFVETKPESNSRKLSPPTVCIFLHLLYLNWLEIDLLFKKMFVSEVGSIILVRRFTSRVS